MIRINQLKLPLEYEKEKLLQKAAKILGISPADILKIDIIKESIDARKKPEIFYSYIVDVTLKSGGSKREESIVRKKKDRNLSISHEKPYCLPECGTAPLAYPPVIIGTGPAGLFCGLMLARKGYCPILLERGEDVDARTRRVEAFWKDGVLNPASNVQFGEGGAGTFSDGKLNTLVKDPSGRNKEVLKILAQAGADPAITYVNKPHVGTDVLRTVVKNIRSEIESLGGEVRFDCRLEDFETQNGHLCSIRVSARKGTSEAGRTVEEIPASALVLAIGHSARDTFAMLAEKPLDMQAKAFAVGLRIQHPQTQINLSQYGREEAGNLGAASYKLTAQTSGGRGVYSFCMCPGGFVVDASSEPGRLAINGMSNHDRAGANANSALIVTVTPEDFPQPGTLGGVTFQRQLEEAAYRCGGGKIPVQLYGDFISDCTSDHFGKVRPAFRGQYGFANLRRILPEALSASFIEAMEGFGHMIKGFDCPDAILAGIESRTSSPVRIPRDETLESAVRGLFPCGEGAGYAGGITSAAMDGIKVAEELIRRYRPLKEKTGELEG